MATRTAAVTPLSGGDWFAGRRAELAALAAAAARPAEGCCRLVVLAGRPGSGRSALAAEFARTVAEQYPDGVYHARLTAPDGTAIASGAVARDLLEQLGPVPQAALALPEHTADRDGSAERDDPACAALRSALAGRRALLVLDDVPDAARLRPLLPAEPDCLVLAVTAGPLTGIADIDPVILGGLDQSAAVELLSSLAGATRIGCDPVGAAELAEACAARPAALRLLAGWLRDHPKAALTEAVRALGPAPSTPAPLPAPLPGSASPALPAQQPPTGPDPRPGPRPKSRGDAPDPRPATSGEPLSDPLPDGEPLVGAFLLQYRALPAPQARLLRMATLAPGRLVDLRTASALAGCPAPEAAQTLARLAERELLEAATGAVDGTERYRVPGRLFGRLAALRESTDRAAEVELARARLLERLVRLVDSARELLETGRVADPLPGPLRLRSPAHARHWLAAEREQLLVAAQDAIGRTGLDSSAARLVDAVLRALPSVGAAPVDRYRLHRLVLRLAERRGDVRRAAAARLNLGDLRATAGHWRQAADHYRAALDHARTAADEPAAARALEGVADTYRAQGDAVRAADWYGRALALRRHSADRPAEARLLLRCAESYTAQHRYEQAGREYRAAAVLLRRLGDERALGTVRTGLERLRLLAEAEPSGRFEG